MSIEKKQEATESFKLEFRNSKSESAESSVSEIDELSEISGHRKDIRDLLDAAQDKHFVFFYGMPAAGKTAVLGSILYAMQQPGAKGKLFVHGAGDNFFRQGLVLWKNIATAFQNEQFPPRTPSGSTIQLYAEYQPDRSKNERLDIIFLEMGGEDLQQVMISPDGERALPFHIDIFFNIPKVKLVFIVVSSWEDAKKDDMKINNFIDFLNSKYKDLIESRFLLLITKWDAKKRNKDEDIVSFIKREMPQTYSKLNEKKNIVQQFSVGNVITISSDGRPGPDDIIRPFDVAAGQRLFGRIYETFTGISPERTGWIEKICIKFRSH